MSLLTQRYVSYVISILYNSFEQKEIEFSFCMQN